MKYQIANIKIGERQRIDMGDVSELADSLRRLGQIHSIGVDENGLLIWGMRRTLAAKSLGWTEIEATVRTGLSLADAQEIELEEDIRRKERTWQEQCLALTKLYAIKGEQARLQGKTFGIRDMATYSGFSKTFVANYVFTLGHILNAVPRDTAVWECSSYVDALNLLRDRREKEAYEEMQRRRAAIVKTVVAVPVTGDTAPSAVQTLDKTPQPTRLLTLRERAMLYSQIFTHLGPPNTPLFYLNKDGREFIHGFWFVGGGNISNFYGSYQVEYLRRITSLFPDIVGKEKIVHLFSGSIPISPDYTVVGITDNNNPPDIVCDAHNLSSGLSFQPLLIYADPPYSIEDSEHYGHSMVNRDRVISECAVVLAPGGYLVWIDQALPVFNNDELNLVGVIGYIRSTGNRFRMISIFKKPCKPIISSTAPSSIPSPSLAEPLSEAPQSLTGPLVCPSDTFETMQPKKDGLSSPLLTSLPPQSSSTNIPPTNC